MASLEMSPLARRPTTMKAEERREVVSTLHLKKKMRQSRCVTA
jgi:hypothetical protein